MGYNEVRMLVHRFILVSSIPERIFFPDYDQSKMIKIADDFILKYHVPIRKVKMHCEHLGNLIDGLAYHGTTILDVQMAKNLKSELQPYVEKSSECKRLVSVLDDAIAQNKYIIHFGI